MKKKKIIPTDRIQITDIYINPLTDFGFKRMFSDKELLLNFLNEVLPDVAITDITYEPTEVIGEIADDRRSFLTCSARLRPASMSLLRCNAPDSTILLTALCFMALI